MQIHSSRRFQPIVLLGLGVLLWLTEATAQAQLPPEVPPNNAPPPTESPVQPPNSRQGYKGGSVKAGTDIPSRMTSVKDPRVQRPAHLPSAIDRTQKIEDWRRSIEDLDKNARRGRYKRLANAAPRLIDDLLATGAGETDTREILGLALVYQALGDADQGLWRRAEWRWHTALHIQPDLAAWDLSIYGKHGKWLKSRTLRLEGTAPPPKKGPPVLLPPYEDADGNPLPGWSEPRIEEEPPAPPRFSSDASPWRQIAAPERAEVLVSKWGELSQPRILAGDIAHPAMVYWVLEALWTTQPITPAQVDEENRDALWDINLLETLPWTRRAASRW